MKQKDRGRRHQIPPEGVYTATWIPYGYRYDPNSTALVMIDTEVADYVQFIFHQYLEGISLTQICKQLNEQGAPNPALRKRQLGQKDRLSKDTERWNAASLNQILFNPMYAGDWILSGRVWDAVYLYSGEPAPAGVELPTVEENHHEALISREDMKRASLKYLQDRTLRTAKKQAVRQNATNQTHFSIGSVLRCGECGRAMHKNEIFTGDGTSFIAYTCSSFSLQQASKCASRFYRLDEILSSVQPLVAAERKEALKYLDMVTEESKSVQYIRVENFLQRQIDQAVDSVRKNLSAFHRLKARYNGKKLSESEYLEGQQKMEEENRISERQVMAALIQIRKFRATCSESNPWLSLYTSIPEEPDFAADEELLKQIVERIDLYPDKPPAITLARKEEKEDFLNTLYMPIRTRHLTYEDTSSDPADSEDSTESCENNDPSADNQFRTEPLKED